MATIKDIGTEVDNILRYRGKRTDHDEEVARVIDSVWSGTLSAMGTTDSDDTLERFSPEMRGIDYNIGDYVAKVGNGYYSGIRATVRGYSANLTFCIEVKPMANSTAREWWIAIDNGEQVSLRGETPFPELIAKACSRISSKVREAIIGTVKGDIAPPPPLPDPGADNSRGFR